VCRQNNFHLSCQLPDPARQENSGDRGIIKSDYNERANQPQACKISIKSLEQKKDVKH